MFGRLIYNLKKDKLFLTFFVITCAAVIVNLINIAVNIVWLVRAQTNSVTLPASFLKTNVFFCVINGCFLIFYVIYFVIKSKKLSSKNN